MFAEQKATGARLASSLMPDPDLCTEEEIMRLVHTFDAKVRYEDPALAPIFGSRIVDWIGAWLKWATSGCPLSEARPATGERPSRSMRHCPGSPRACSTAGSPSFARPPREGTTRPCRSAPTISHIGSPAASGMTTRRGMAGCPTAGSPPDHVATVLAKELDPCGMPPGRKSP